MIIVLPSSHTHSIIFWQAVTDVQYSICSRLSWLVCTPHPSFPLSEYLCNMGVYVGAYPEHFFLSGHHFGCPGFHPLMSLNAGARQTCAGANETKLLWVLGTDLGRDDDGIFWTCVCVSLTEWTLLSSMCPVYTTVACGRFSLFYTCGRINGITLLSNYTPVLYKPWHTADTVHVQVHVFVCVICLCCRLGLSFLAWHI